MKKVKNVITGILVFAILCVCSSLPVLAGTASEYKFIQSVVLEGARNVKGDASPLEAGWGGMKITVGKKDLYVTEVGRMNADGSAKKHNMLIVDASDNSLVKEGISVSTPNDAKTKEFIYVKVSNVVLKAGKSYYLVSDFQGPNDAWYDKSVAVTTKDATLDGHVLLNLSTNAWTFTKSENIGYGPVDFKYTLEKSSTDSKGSATSGKESGAISKESSSSDKSQTSVTESRSIAEILQSEKIHTYTKQFFPNGKRNVTIGDAGNYAGWVGMKITVGAEAIIVTALGRLQGASSDSKHKMIIVDADSNAIIIDNIQIIGEKVEKYSYTDLPKPVVLQPGKSYFIVTDVMSWTDEWYDSTTITTNSAAELKGAVLMGLNGWELFDVPVSWGPVDFKYVMTSAERKAEQSDVKSDQVSSTEAISDLNGQNSSLDNNDGKQGSMPIIFIVAIVVVTLAAAGFAVYYYIAIKKKKNEKQ